MNTHKMIKLVKEMLGKKILLLSVYVTNIGADTVYRDYAFLYNQKKTLTKLQSNDSYFYYKIQIK